MSTQTNHAPASRPTSTDEIGATAEVELAQASEQALASIAERHEHASTALQTLFEQQRPTAATDQANTTNEAPANASTEQT